MEIVEVRDLAQARAYLLQCLWLQRVVVPSAVQVRIILEWAQEIAASGQPLPPIGFVADLGNLVFGHDYGRHAHDTVEVPGWSHILARSYEDHLLGKIYSDWTFERATDALRRYTGRDQAKGLAYVVKQLRERGQIGGVELSPAIIRGLLTTSGDELLREGYELLSIEGPMPLIVRQYEGLVSAARRMAEVLGAEDVIALEQRTALADMGQYVAHRQILQITARLEARLPPRPVRPLVGRKEVPTRVMDEDQYPVGGYTSISTKGSIESLLHSQLAFMERAERPDLFDMKFVRDELFYYSRDENQFLRRRRSFIFALFPNLVAARFKDPMLPYQRIVMSLGVILTIVRRLSDWLSTDSLIFELVFVNPSPDKPQPLAQEMELLQLLLQEPMERGAVRFRTLETHSALERFCEQEARTNQVQCLTLSSVPITLNPEGAVITTLTVNDAKPDLTDAHGVTVSFDTDDPFEHWAAALTRLLELWV